MKSTRVLGLVLLPALAACGSSPPPATAPSSKAAPQITAAPPVAKSDAKVVRRSDTVLSRKAGGSVVTSHPDGSAEFSYQYINNGRGPKVDGRWRTAPDGTLAFFAAKGTHVRATPIDESFSIDTTGGKTRARWKSAEEQGEKELTGPAFYIPVAPLPEITEILFAALQKHGGKIALLPDGEARLERFGEATVRASGQEKHLVAWGITGLDLLPQYFWAEDDGSFFGFAGTWWWHFPEGWEGANDTLVAAEKAFDAKRERDQFARFAHRAPAEGMVFQHARVLDVAKKRWLPDHSVTVVGGKIVGVGPSKGAKVPKGAEVVDLSGKALAPGLWEMHAHLTREEGMLDIAAGVTTSRDLGNDPDFVDELKKHFDEGAAVGPHVLRSGFIEGRGAGAAGSKITATTEEEAKAAVDFYAKRGWEGIKIYNSIKPELVPILARLAHEKKMRVSGHIPAFMRAEEAVRAGYDEIQHMNMLFLNFFVEKDTDTRSLLRFTLVADKAPSFDIASKPAQDFIKLLRERKTVVDPTLDVFEKQFLARQGRVLPSYKSLVDRLPLQVQRGYLTGGLKVPEGKDEHYAQAFGKMLQMLKALHDAGVTIVAGTDEGGGLHLHHELALYVQSGIPTGDVLQLATLGSARVMGRDKTSGSIAVGKDADFFVVDGDPLEHIEDLRKITTTVRGGVVFAAGDLHEAMGVKR
ncbi:amidohydrolase family protein [Pendulispora brunnea]|uniref:Amidohydrolase family protein n=1 Tax=Pendulispora brunnea TaxID=2905690 RepID=A0ABZ2K3K1_9BACT